MTRFAETQQGVTHVAATLDTLWTGMDAHAMVRSRTKPILQFTHLIFTFVENNECSSSSTNNCQQICVNTPGSYNCQCRTGYRLNRDGRTCAGMSIIESDI